MPNERDAQSPSMVQRTNVSSETPIATTASETKSKGLWAFHDRIVQRTSWYLAIIVAASYIANNYIFPHLAIVLSILGVVAYAAVLVHHGYRNYRRTTRFGHADVFITVLIVALTARQSYLAYHQEGGLGLYHVWGLLYALDAAAWGLISFIAAAVSDIRLEHRLKALNVAVEMRNKEFLSGLHAILTNPAIVKEEDKFFQEYKVLCEQVRACQVTIETLVQAQQAKKPKPKSRKGKATDPVPPITSDSEKPPS